MAKLIEQYEPKSKDNKEKKMTEWIQAVKNNKKKN